LLLRSAQQALGGAQRGSPAEPKIQEIAMKIFRIEKFSHG
jgi:hypothetical protein